MWDLDSGAGGESWIERKVEEVRQNIYEEAGAVEVPALLLSIIIATGNPHRFV